MKQFSMIMAAASLAAPAVLADDFPVTVTDDQPAEVTIETQPKNLLTLSAFAADTAVALGITPVGVTTYQGRRPLYLGDVANEMIDLGDITAPNFEVMAGLDADLVVGMTMYNGPFSEELNEIGQFIAYSPAGIDTSYRQVSELGKAYGYSAEAEAMNADYAALLADMAAKAPENGPTYLFIWNFFDAMYGYQNPLMTAQIPSLIGGENVAGDGDGNAENAFVILDPEQLLEMDPEYLFVFNSHGAGVKNNPVYSQLQAIKNGHAYSVGYQYSQPGGPIAREMIARELGHLMYPDLFAMPDMPEGSTAVPLTFVD